MTRLPGRHRLSGEQVLLFLENIRERLTLIALTEDEYPATIKEAAEAGVIGGTIYDLLADATWRESGETFIPGRGGGEARG